MSYTYEIILGRYGGEYAIGTVDKEKAKWWIENHDADTFEDYIMSWDRDEWEEENFEVPQHAKIEEEWWEHDDIMHENCVEFADSNWMEITNSDTGESVTIDFKEIDRKKVNVNSSEEWRANEFVQNNEAVVLYANAFEKGSFVAECDTDSFDADGNVIELDSPYKFVLNEPFDKEKLHDFACSVFEGCLLLNSFKYDDKSFTIMGMDSMGKGQSAWLNWGAKMGFKTYQSNKSLDDKLTELENEVVEGLNNTLTA